MAVRMMIQLADVTRKWQSHVSQVRLSGRCTVVHVAGHERVGFAYLGFFFVVIQARKTCACIWFFWALNYHDFQGRLKRRGVLVLLCASTMQIDRAWHMCWQNSLHLSLSYLHMYGPAQVQKSLCGILMLPIQFVGAKATSWMSSVDTSVQHMTSQDGFIYKRS